MKTIALFLLFTVMAFGQDSTMLIRKYDSNGRLLYIQEIVTLPIQNSWPLDSVRFTRQPFTLPTIKIDNMGFFDALVTYWDAYSDECFNDSTKECVDGRWTNYVDGFSVLDECFKWGWRHKEPTFPDFMEWVRRKVKK